MAVLKTVIIGVRETGFVVTGADGRASIAFVGAYPAKPNLQLTAELDPALDTVYPQIVSWELDGVGNYIGAAIQVSDDGGKGEANVTVGWLIV